MNRALADELAAMAERDQTKRRSLREAPLSAVGMMEWTRVDVENADRPRGILAEHGWPGRSLVGEEGAERAWLIAQHADRHLDFHTPSTRAFASPSAHCARHALTGRKR